MLNHTQRIALHTKDFSLPLHGTTHRDALRHFYSSPNIPDSVELLPRYVDSNKSSRPRAELRRPRRPLRPACRPHRPLRVHRRCCPDQCCLLRFFHEKRLPVPNHRNISAMFCNQLVKQANDICLYLAPVSFPLYLFHPFVIFRIRLFFRLKLKMLAQRINVTIGFNDKHLQITKQKGYIRANVTRR